MENEQTAEPKPIDVDKLLVLVEARPEIYNITMKDHHNQDVISKIWQDIANELNVPAAECKTKWHSLRTSYTRYLRELKKIPSGSAGKKKKWYLADNMSFLLKYIGCNTKNSSNLALTDNNDTASDGRDIEEADESINTDVGDQTENSSQLGEGLPQVEEINPHKRKRKTVAEIVAQPMVEYLKTVTDLRNKNEEDPTMSFFKSILPDVNKLSDRRKRSFKTSIMQTLNLLLDQQEEEEEEASRPPSSNSCDYSAQPNSENLYLFL